MIFIPRTNFVNIYFSVYCILIVLIKLIRQSFYRLNPFSANQSTVISRKRVFSSRLSAGSNQNPEQIMIRLIL